MDCLATGFPAAAGVAVVPACRLSGLATTIPTTLAGVAAVLRYANECEDKGEEWPATDTIGSDGWHYQLRQTAARALEALQGLA